MYLSNPFMASLYYEKVLRIICVFIHLPSSPTFSLTTPPPHFLVFSHIDVHLVPKIYLHRGLLCIPICFDNKGRKMYLAGRASSLYFLIAKIALSNKSFPWACCCSTMRGATSVTAAAGITMSPFSRNLGAQIFTGVKSLLMLLGRAWSLIWSPCLLILLHQQPQTGSRKSKVLMPSFLL